jgi:membrane protein
LSQYKLYLKLLISSFKDLILSLQDNRIFTGAAALAFYATLASIPFMICILALLPFLPIDNIQATLTAFTLQHMPGDAGVVIINTVNEFLKKERPDILSLGFITFIWASSSGMTAIVEQINLSHGTTSDRSLLQQRFYAICLTFFYFIMIIVTTSLVLVSNALREIWDQNYSLNLIISTIRYVIAYLGLFFSFVFIYYLAPSKKQKIKNVLPGSFLGSSFIIITAVIFNYYISNFNEYDKIYGSLGKMIVFMLWLYISGFVLLLGADYNCLVNKKLNQKKLYL